MERMTYATCFVRALVNADAVTRISILPGKSQRKMLTLLFVAQIQMRRTKDIKSNFRFYLCIFKFSTCFQKMAISFSKQHDLERETYLCLLPS